MPELPDHLTPDELHDKYYEILEEHGRDAFVELAYRSLLQAIKETEIEDEVD